MAQTNVSSCVCSILSSFTRGLDVLTQLRERRRRRRRSKASKAAVDDEIQLEKSLRRGPEDIGREYGNGFHAAGDNFAVGDAIAQTSLAEVLLKLNTGLVGLIGSFLSSDKHGAEVDYHSLTSLSESSRVDTCKALRQLFRRMSQLSVVPAMKSKRALQNGEPMARQSKPHREHKKKKRTVQQQSKIYGPTLARVTIQNSSQPSQIALVKPGERRKRSPSSSVPSSGSNVCSRKASSSALGSPPPPYEMVEKHGRPRALRSQTVPQVAKPRRKQSAADVRSAPPAVEPGPIRATKSTPRLRTSAPEESYDHLDPMPATMALPSVPRTTRRPTPTYYSIASDSTKLGEIPLHKWPVPFDFDAMSLMNREAEMNGWPLEGPGGEAKKKRFGLFRLFRKKETTA